MAGIVPLLLALSGCGGGGGAGGSPGDSARAVAAAPATRPPALPDSAVTRAPAEEYVNRLGVQRAKLTDGQVLGVAMALNSGEVQQGRLALQRSRRAAVREFAGMLVTDHTAASGKLREVAAKLQLQAQPSPPYEHAEAAGRQWMDAVLPLHGFAFDTTFAGREMDAHQAALDALRGTLIPAAHAPELRGVLEQMATTVEWHLQQAIQAHSTLVGA